jgi:periplasmic protein TonB
MPSASATLRGGSAMSSSSKSSSKPSSNSFSMSRVSFRRPVLAWAVADDDEERFRRITRRVLGVALVLAIVLPFLPLPKADLQRAQPLPPPLAKLLLERQTPPPPPKPVPQVAQADKPLADQTLPPKPEPPRKDERAAVPEARKPVPNKPPGEAIAAARKRASGVGLLAASSEIAAIAAAPAAVQLRQDIAPGPGVGTGQGPGVGAGTEAGLPARAMITSNAGRGSGGLNTAPFSRDTGGGGLAGRATTVVEGYAGGGGGGGAGGGGAGGSGRAGAGGGAGAGPAAGGTLTRSGSGKASRSIEEIKLVFERNKGAIYALYNRALREDSSLQGKVVVQLKIDPSGAVIDCRILSSELKNDDLERKLVARIRQFDFGAKDVEPMVVSWPVDFLPS